MVGVLDVKRFRDNTEAPSIAWRGGPDEVEEQGECTRGSQGTRENLKASSGPREHRKSRG
jgi:hypothetical protein